jgi:hypothetical protein
MLGSECQWLDEKETSWEEIGGGGFSLVFWLAIA